MAALILFLQVVFVIGLSSVTFLAVSHQVYLIVAVLMAVVTLGLITTTSKIKRDAPWWALTLILCVAFGVFWPSLPVIAAWGAWSHRTEETTLDVPPEDPRAG